MRDRTLSFLRRTAALWVVVALAVVGYFTVSAFADDGDSNDEAAVGTHDHSSHDHGDDDHGHTHDEEDVVNPFGFDPTEKAKGALPAMDPCTLVTKDEASSLLGQVSVITEAG